MCIKWLCIKFKKKVEMLVFSVISSRNAKRKLALCNENAAKACTGKVVIKIQLGI